MLNAHHQVYETPYWKQTAENERIIRGSLDQGINPAVPRDTVNYHVTRILDGDNLSVKVNSVEVFGVISLSGLKGHNKGGFCSWATSGAIITSKFNPQSGHELDFSFQVFKVATKSVIEAIADRLGS